MWENRNVFINGRETRRLRRGDVTNLRRRATFAERARTLVYLGRVGSLSTFSRKQQGSPSDPDGLWIGRPRESYLPHQHDGHAHSKMCSRPAFQPVSDPARYHRRSLGASRVTLLGNTLPVPVPEVAEARKLYLARYANSKYWVDFDDFSFYRWRWWTFTT